MLFIPNEVIRSKELTNDEVVAYVFLQIHTYSVNYDSCQFTIPQVVDQIKGITKSHSTYDHMALAIKKLIKKGALVITQENSKCWRIFMQSFELPEEGGFVKVDAEDLRSIMDCKARGKSKLLRYYLLLLSYMHPTCKKEMTWFANELGTSVKTISTYNQHLEELKLIKVKRSDQLYDSNTYSRYKDMV